MAFEHTKSAVLAVMKLDPSLSEEHKRCVLRILNSENPTAFASASIEPLVKREEAAALLGLSVSRIDQLGKAGVLDRVPTGARRARGFTRASVRKQAEGGSTL